MSWEKHRLNTFSKVSKFRHLKPGKQNIILTQLFTFNGWSFCSIGNSFLKIALDSIKREFIVLNPCISTHATICVCPCGLMLELKKTSFATYSRSTVAVSYGHGSICCQGRCCSNC